MPRKKQGRKKAHWSAHAMPRRNKTKTELSRSRGHIPVALLKERLAKMPRHQLELARLIRRRQAAGE